MTLWTTQSLEEGSPAGIECQRYPNLMVLLRYAFAHGMQSTHSDAMTSTKHAFSYLGLNIDVMAWLPALRQACR